MNQRHEVLFNQLNSYRSYILHVLENVTKEEADIVPNGFNNNIRWNMGHIYLDQYLWIHALTKDKMVENRTTSNLFWLWNITCSFSPLKPLPLKN